MKVRAAIRWLAGIALMSSGVSQGQAPATMPLSPATSLPFLQSGSWDPGEIALARSPDPLLIRPMLLPMFRGLPRFGAPRMYGVFANNAETDLAHRTMKERHALKSDLEHSRGTYLKLLVIDHLRGQLPASGLDQGYQYPSPRAARVPGIANDWFNLFTELRTTLTEAGCVRYLRLDRQPCPQGGTYQSVTANVADPLVWGGAPHPEVTEDKGRAAYRDFVEQTLPHYLAWSRQLTREVYLVNSTPLGPYDAAIGGITVLLPPINWDREIKSAGYSALAAPYRHVWKTSAANAESVIAPMRSRLGGPQVYYAYKVTLRVEETNQGPRPSRRADAKYASQSPQAVERLRLPASFIAAPGSAMLEVFSDEGLKEKLFEVPIR